MSRRSPSRCSASACRSQGLAQWVRGLPAPELEARGWKVEYQAHDEQRRPTRMRVTYPGLELRLAISKWQ